MRLQSSCTLLLATCLGLTGCEVQSKSRGISEPADRTQEPGFVSLFDGKTLTGWHAIPTQTTSDWSVRDGTITGHGSANRLAYLVWRDLQLTDFELRLSYRMLTDGNSGVEVRAQPDTSGKRPFEGYHADLGHVGIGPHILGAWDFHFARRKEHPCNRGTRLVIRENGSARYSKLDPDTALALSDVRKRDWNHLRVVVRGNHFQSFINGKLAAEFTDNARPGRLDHGAIGLQLHDKGMQVAFKDIRLRRLREPPPR